MARELRIQYPGAFYHVTCRGNEHKKIFSDDDDHHRFLVQLAESLETYQVVLYAYIMMPNHFHQHSCFRLLRELYYLKLISC